MTTTDTPRTDACRHCGSTTMHRRNLCGTENGNRTTECYLWEKLQKAEAEVSKLNHQLLKTESDLLQSQDINSFLDAEFRIACKRAEKAEEEVERLDHLLADASETNHKLGVEVERLKSDRVHLITYCANLLEEVEGAKVESQSKINLTGGG
jgi:septal ring factor EnvC (AmiA/AmiB activator)